MRLLVAVILGLGVSSVEAAEARSVTLWGRDWTVTEKVDLPGTFVAIQSNPNNDLFGRPAIRKSIQARRAIETATGCKVVWSGMTKTIRDEFSAPVNCP